MDRIRRALYQGSVCPACGHEIPVKRDANWHLPGSIRARLFLIMHFYPVQWWRADQLADEISAHDGRRETVAAVRGALMTMRAAHEVEWRGHRGWGVWRRRSKSANPDV